MNISSISNTTLAKLSAAFVFVCIFLWFVVSGAGEYFCAIGVCIGLWGGMSATCAEWKQARPDQDITKYEKFANLSSLIAIGFIFLLLVIYLW